MYCLQSHYIKDLLELQTIENTAIESVWVLLRNHMGWYESDDSFPLSFLCSVPPERFGEVLTGEDVKWFLYNYSKQLPAEKQGKLNKVNGDFSTFNFSPLTCISPSLFSVA